MFGISTFIQDARETYLGEYAKNPRPMPTEEDIFQASNEEDTQFEDKFADSVSDVEKLVADLEKETSDVMSNNTKTLMKEKLTSILSTLNAIDGRLVLTERNRINPNEYYRRFRQILINKVKDECAEEVTDEMISAMESFIQMSYAPIKMMIENMADEPDHIEGLFRKIESNTEGFVPSLTKPKSQFIEVPVTEPEDQSHLHMTEEKAPTTTRGKSGKKIQTNDPVMGE